MSFPDYSVEDEVSSLGYKYVVGTDEAGRGSGSGPVVAAAVNIPKEHRPLFINKVNDSKKLSPKKREELFDLIMQNCMVGVQDISPEIIDKINILEATKLAMRSSIEQLGYFDYILIDGTVDLSKYIKDCPMQKIIRGDSKSVSIAAASIIAKVTRDRIMLRLHEEWPIYSWDKNKGYLTKDHIDAINTYGITKYHRQSFKKVGR